MNYFELFDIPVQLRVEAGQLAPRFFELSRKFHPDYYINESPEVQQEALDNSAMLNRAWKTFQQPDETLKYVLQLKGLLEEEEKFKLPPDFLMEVMEINEQLMDGTADKDAVTASIDNIQKDIYGSVKEIVEGGTESDLSEEKLLQVKVYYYKKKYLDRIRKQLTADS
jgi:molecular chaperone HscB